MNPLAGSVLEDSTASIRWSRPPSRVCTIAHVNHGAIANVRSKMFGLFTAIARLPFFPHPPLVPLRLIFRNPEFGHELGTKSAAGAGGGSGAVIAARPLVAALAGMGAGGAPAASALSWVGSMPNTAVFLPNISPPVIFGISRADGTSRPPCGRGIRHRSTSRATPPWPKSRAPINVPPGSASDAILAFPGIRLERVGGGSQSYPSSLSFGQSPTGPGRPHRTNRRVDFRRSREPRSRGSWRLEPATLGAKNEAGFLDPASLQ